jgi:hypothetical protein
MGRRRRGRNTKILWSMILLAIAYWILLYYLESPTGTILLDGAIGVMLGLYVCSHPAANAVDVLFMERGAFQQLSSEWSGAGWLGLNLLVLFVGWLLIFMGTTRFVS